MHRYLALIYSPLDTASKDRVAATEAALLAITPPWVLAYKNSGVTVVHQTDARPFPTAHLLANHHGVVIGLLFRRSYQGNVAWSAQVDLDPSESDHIVHSDGRHLVTNYWGAYVAIVHDAATGRCNVLRDPTANLACYHTKWNNIEVIFSDLEDIERHIRCKLSVDCTYITARLIAGERFSRNSGLKEIEDLPGGECITFSPAGESRTVLWHPAHFCFGSDMENAHRAEQELRSTVFYAVHTLASSHSDIMVRLSGGLDSAIVTTCLAQQDSTRNVTCLNYYVRSNPTTQSGVPLPIGFSRENIAKLKRIIGSADERQYARSVAQKCGFGLLEKERKVSDVDFRRAFDAPPTPRPSNLVFLFHEDDIEVDYATNIGATAFFTGDAGDIVFYCTLRAIGAMDYAYRHPFGSRLIHHLQATAKLSGESFARIIGKAIRYGHFRLRLPAPYDTMTRPHLLQDDAAQSISRTYFRHPWLESTLHMCPGKRIHINGVLAAVPFYHHVLRRELVAPSVRPLASQPVVETCLRIPSYVLLANGVSRGLARQAFRDLLPPEIVGRTVKGLTQGFWQDVVRHNLPVLRSSMLDGRLVKEGILDRRKLENYLIDEQPFIRVRTEQIMDYFACEVWLSQRT